jgi:hypothetical protein
LVDAQLSASGYNADIRPRLSSDLGPAWDPTSAGDEHDLHENHVVHGACELVTCRNS